MKELPNKIMLRPDFIIDVVKEPLGDDISSSSYTDFKANKIVINEYAPLIVQHHLLLAELIRISDAALKKEYDQHELAGVLFPMLAINGLVDGIDAEEAKAAIGIEAAAS